jgi:hypothetical protein
VGTGDDRPVRRPLVDHRTQLLERGKLVAGEQHGVEPFKRERVDDARERDARLAVFGERVEPLAVPGRDVVERGRVSVCDPRSFDQRVVVDDIDEASAAPVGRLGDRASELLLTNTRAERDELAGLDVGAMDRQSGQCGETVVQGRRS